MKRKDRASILQGNGEDITQTYDTQGTTDDSKKESTKASKLLSSQGEKGKHPNRRHFSGSIIVRIGNVAHLESNLAHSIMQGNASPF
jgi:predicted HicB family RNase H-like nuclease